MRGREEIGAAREADTPHAEAAIRSVFERVASAGLLDGIEELLAISSDDVELSAYAQLATAEMGGDRPEALHGKDEVRRFFRDRVEQGFTFQLRPRRFSTEGDTVAVAGSVRVTRPDGSFAETRVRWSFRFRGGLVESVAWKPSADG